jgi:hypothetical protein
VAPGIVRQSFIRFAVEDFAGPTDQIPARTLPISRRKQPIPTEKFDVPIREVCSDVCFNRRRGYFWRMAFTVFKNAGGSCRYSPHRLVCSWPLKLHRSSSLACIPVWITSFPKHNYQNRPNAEDLILVVERSIPDYRLLSNSLLYLKDFRGVLSHWQGDNEGWGRGELIFGMEI